ncbi:TetR family transcriptional regulator [Nonomuraea sp. NEAU-A123]|uniref:TetR family transcriptional regulator n=1 Tax=Nonomuraea sp. NEAU-A123 TaxID=2839649 RepID=UPI001BE4AFC2|nr:TetR family transcriptional regulator [Nonomuraea sp. NEAU-A123]MBT2225220.1 TetR family transcriptional regulator [Nonomuraea sp. NEAU-A123]
MTRVGLRERKKAQTRKRLADTAFAMFRERGFDAVTVAEIADACDIAVSTLFTYFPSKESLVFDQEAAHEQRLGSVVRDRPAGATILDALETYLAAPEPRQSGEPSREEFLHLVHATPALRDHFMRMQRNWETTLAQAIAEEAGLSDDDLQARALARFALDVGALAEESPDPARTLRILFARLRNGWADVDRTPTAGPDASSR